MEEARKRDNLNWFVGTSALGAFTSSLLFGFLIWLSYRRQRLALQGDEIAALKIVMPCYQPLYIFLGSVYLVISVALALTFVTPLSILSQFLVLQFYSLTMLALFTIVPLLLTQNSVSYMAFVRTAWIIGPWYVLCSLTWGLSDLPQATTPLQIMFWIVSCIPSILLSLGILLKMVPSRIQMGSTSNRASVEYMLVYSCFFVGINIACVPRLQNKDLHSLWNLGSLLAIFSILWNQIFPLALHRTLLADTKFWRGLGRHNRGGLSYTDGNKTGVSVHKPTVGLAVVTGGLQKMMSEVEDITIDFAYLQLQSQIGEGASAHVYRGHLKQRDVAIKVFVPPEITLDVIDEFMKESKLLAELRHENIVRFMGICIRPPQIAMVMELCIMGNLKTSLKQYPAEWKREWRVRACYDAARAVDYLHGCGYIHRDLKADNFFIGEGRVVKLGDFGEATKQRKYRPSVHQGGNSARMSIVGTVAYMAPELVAATKKYSESIDIYSMGITFWEIWTGLDPYEGFNTFQIYNHVTAGNRPELPADTPQRFRELVEMAWSQDEQRRPVAAAIAACLKSILWDEFNYRVPTPVEAGLLPEDDTGGEINSPGSRLSRAIKKTHQATASALVTVTQSIGNRISMENIFRSSKFSRDTMTSIGSDGRASDSMSTLDIAEVGESSANEEAKRDKDFIPDEENIGVVNNPMMNK